MIFEALAFIAGAASAIAAWLALDRPSPGTASDAARKLGSMGGTARAARLKAERAAYVQRHTAALLADIERERARVAKPAPEFLANAEGKD